MRASLGILSSFLTVALVSGQQTASQPPPPSPCLVAEQTQLSFWLGEWELTWPGEKQGQTDHGTNSIQRVLDGCAIEENFSGGTAMHLRGRSLSIFDTISGKWKQTWVDNEGGYLDFTGEFRDGQMILAREAVRRNGQKCCSAWSSRTSHPMNWTGVGKPRPMAARPGRSTGRFTTRGRVRRFK